MIITSLPIKKLPGNKGEDAIIELMGATVNNDVKAHGLVINRIRLNTSRP
jgi:hypothetical protein